MLIRLKIFFVKPIFIWCRGRKNKNRGTCPELAEGFSTLEILIAFGVLIISITAVILVVFGNQSVAVDTETNNEALSKAKISLEGARATSRQSFNSLVSTTSDDGFYLNKLTVSDLTQCKKQATGVVSWLSGARPLSISLSTYLSNIAGALALGGDCATEPPSSNWDNPQRFAADTMSPGKPTAIDVLNKIAYLGADKSPFFYIADTRAAILGQTSGLFVTFANGFDLGAAPNALDVIHDTIGNNYYVFAAMNTASNQLKVINVTDIHNPVLVATRTLKNVSVTGSYPEGWRLFYFKNRLYITTRETSSREFHIFDVSNPMNPIELGNGTALNITVNDLAVEERSVGGVTKRLAYLATDQNSGELQVYDVTDPLNTGAISEVAVARQDLSGDQNGESVFIIGNKLYFGRQSTPSGADLYIFDITNPTLGLTQLGSQDIGTGVLYIRVAGRFAFLVTPKTTKEFQVWNISNPSSITLIKEYNFGNLVEHGIDYEPDFVYATGQATPNFQIIYSP